jgi:CubicO group peptidase (beta-lactamase class C family)
MLKQLGAVIVLGLGAALPAAVPQDSIESFIDGEMPASGVPGLAYAVVADGEVTEFGARGVVRAGGDTAVTPDTPFLSGSISKSFTALAFMQLVESGRVDLDAGISQYLEVFSGRPADAVTVRQLLSHTSGFSTLQGNSSHVDAAGSEDELARRVEGIAGLTPAYPPGERWEYSNANYLVLGRLVEVVSGQDYQSYLTANVLEPIGMTNSFVSDGEVHESMAAGHTPWFWTKRPLPENTTSRGMAPAGGVVASANDLARYLAVMMNGQDDVLSAEGKAQMMRPAGGAATFYGFGWFVDSGHRTVWHSGSTPGVETLATMMPSQDAGVVVLVNGGSGVGFGETAQLRNGITARALGLDYDGEGSRLSQRALFLGLVLLPIFYLVSVAWAWGHRTAIRAKRHGGFAGLFSLWFPLLTTIVAAWVVVFLVPNLMGAPITTISLFQPDMGLALVATAVTGVLWAVFRLGVAYTGRTSAPLGPAEEPVTV